MLIFQHPDLNIEVSRDEIVDLTVNQAKVLHYLFEHSGWFTVADLTIGTGLSVRPIYGALTFFKGMYLVKEDLVKNQKYFTYCGPRDVEFKIKE